jgi:hypothetical protein
MSACAMATSLGFEEYEVGRGDAMTAIILHPL